MTDPMLSSDRVAELAPSCVDLLTVAADWHGGQTSALFSLASTGAIWSWDHLERLAWELRDAVDDVESGRVDLDDDGTATLAECAAWVESIAESNPYARGGFLYGSMGDPGGYNLLALTDDGELLCEQCATDPANPVHPATDGARGDGWGIAAWICDGETESETDTLCAHCGRVVIAGYGEVDA